MRTEFEFNISDFNEPGKAFGDAELYAAIDRGAIVILDDATIANMKAKRAGASFQFSELFKMMWGMWTLHNNAEAKTDEG